MKHVLFLICTVLLALPAWVFAQPSGQPLTPDDFARGFRLEVAGGEPVYAVVLPRDVYRTVTRPDLGDVRVFNGEGEELPHAIDRRGVVQDDASAVVDLPFFPVYGRPGAEAADLAVQVRRGPGGALVEVTGQARQASSGQAIRAYLVDVSALDAPVEQLSFSWADTASFVAEVAAEASDDLTTWHRWGTPVTLAQLRYGGHTLIRNELPLPVRRARYARLTWSSDEAPAPLLRVAAQPVRQPEPERQWDRLAPVSAEGGVFRFDQPGYLPVDRVRLDLPQANTLVRVRLASAPDPDGPWTEHFRGIRYRLTLHGHELTPDPIPVPRTSDRYWRLTVEPEGGGLGRGTPVLELGWTPERLLFVARGAPPYTLAFGRAGEAPSAFHPDELLRLLPERNTTAAALPSAAIGEAVELGGDERLTPRTDVPWSRVVLWAMLVLGVALLATMALRLLKQVRSEG